MQSAITLIVLLIVWPSILVANRISRPDRPTTISTRNYVRIVVFGAAPILDVCPATAERTTNSSIIITETATLQQQTPPTTFVDHYHNGLRAYTGHDWPACVHAFESAIDGYRDQYMVRTSCHIECAHADQRRHMATDYFGENFDHLHYYESAIRRTLCETQCKRKLFGNSVASANFHLDRQTARVFAARKPYEYLQLCYYRVGARVLCFVVQCLCSVKIWCVFFGRMVTQSKRHRPRTRHSLQTHRTR